MTKPSFHPHKYLEVETSHANGQVHYYSDLWSSGLNVNTGHLSGFILYTASGRRELPIPNKRYNFQFGQ